MASTASAPAPPRNALRVLVVEDNVGDVELTRDYLSDVPGCSFSLTHAPTLHAAGEHLRRQAFDAVLLDLNLPDSTGMETLRSVHGLAPDVPVVVLSGEDRPQLQVDVVREGAQDFIGKGESSAALLARSIRYALERQASIRSLTARTQLAERVRHSQKLEAVGTLAGGVAHDFNNLLTVIITCADLALESIPAEAPAHDYLREIHDAALRAASLTQQLLTFARRGPSAPTAVDLNEVVLRMQRMLARLIGEHITFVVTPADDLAPVLADPDRVSQVIANLVVNARDAMPDGGRLEIETANVVLDDADATRYLVSPGPWVRLQVRDSGQGMSPELQARIFEPFFTTKHEKGTGLGLAMVHGIVTQAGGEIVVESAPGAGTTFTMHWPVATSGRDQAPAPAVGIPTRPAGHPRILVVEDEDAVRHVVVQLLEAEGYTIVEAADGAEALRLWREDGDGFALVLTDLTMPGMSGWALGQALQQAGAEVPVLYMSGYPDDTPAAHEGGPDGARALVRKPFARAELLASIRRALDPLRS